MKNILRKDSMVAQAGVVNGFTFAKIANSLTEGFVGAYCRVLCTFGYECYGTQSGACFQSRIPT